MSEVLPFLLLFVPMIAVIGGVIAGVVRTVGRQRIAELAYKERIAAVERGVDLSRLPPVSGGEDRLVPDDARSLTRWLTIVGLVMVFGSAALIVTIAVFDSDKTKWVAALIPLAIGAALLLSAWIVRPRNGTTHTSP